VDGAKHNQAQQLAADEYRRRVLEFFNAHMATPPETDLSPNGTGAASALTPESRTDSPIVPIVPTAPEAPASRDSAKGIGEWGVRNTTLLFLILCHRRSPDTA